VAGFRDKSNDPIRSRVLHEKLIVAQLIKIFPDSYRVHNDRPLLQCTFFGGGYFSTRSLLEQWLLTWEGVRNVQNFLQKVNHRKQIKQRDVSASNLFYKSYVFINIMFLRLLYCVNNRFIQV
jgi:hypothetical protein